MRVSIPAEFSNKIDEIKDPLVFVAGLGMRDSNPKKQYSGRFVKVLGRAFSRNGGWLVSLVDDPRVFFEVHKEQLRIEKKLGNLGAYL